ncbi:MAG: soluble lytic murein transglycosylase [Pseudobdellovibrio sp.]|jgi:soluble lytic murein transglycosylase|nr:soluble lytic murein transglycosylase [Pseudobdellovibrio sp.]
MSRIYIGIFFLFLSTSCRSQSLLPWGDLYEIQKSKSVLSTYTCDDLIEKANDKDFSLKNLAGLRAMARCKDYKFDMSALTDFERRLYSAEIESFSPASENKSTADLSISGIKKLIKKEKSETEKFSLYKQLRARLKKTPSDRKEYLKTTTQMLQWAQQNFKKNKKSSDAAGILYEASQIHARTFWTDDDGETAIKTIDSTVKSLTPKNSVAELYYLKARIEEEKKDFAAAVANYDLAIADADKFQAKSLSFTMDRVMWIKSWILYKQKQLPEAEAALRTLANATTDLSEKSRALFYLGRTIKAQGNRDAEATAIFESIIQNDYFGYYGLVSYRELGRKLPAIKNLKPTNTVKFDLKLETIPQKDIFADLVKFREFALAERATGLISAGNKHDEVNLALYLAQKAKIYMPLFRSFARLNNDEKQDVFINYPELVFPRPYKDQVNEMAEKTKLPPSLIYSIMKQESGFNERARSAADAMGLMQVIPGLAKQLSRKFEVPYKKSEDLYDPEINIQIGSYELMEQVRKQNGKLAYVAAAYNAGPNALSRWLTNRNREDILEFIEEIPYDETRTYIKLIARNKAFYERISNRDTDQEFPPDFLN